MAVVDFESNMGLVYATYNKHFQGYRWLKDDLIQEGMLGLWKACQSFDPGKGNTFATYAVKVIKNEMTMLLRKELKHPKADELDILLDRDCRCALLDAVDRKVLWEEILREAELLGCKDVVLLKVTGLKQAEIAEKLGISQSYVSRLLSSLSKIVKKKLL